MATPWSIGDDEPIRPEDVAADDALAAVDQGAGSFDDGSVPEDADVADVLEQRAEVPTDEDDEMRDA